MSNQEARHVEDCICGHRFRRAYREVWCEECEETKPLHSGDDPQCLALQKAKGDG